MDTSISALYSLHSANTVVTILIIQYIIDYGTVRAPSVAISIQVMSNALGAIQNCLIFSFDLPPTMSML